MKTELNQKQIKNNILCKIYFYVEFNVKLFIKQQYFLPSNFKKHF